MSELTVTIEELGQRLALTVSETDVLQSFVDSGDRGSFYATYNGFSDSDQISVQGRISTFSGTVGATAFATNRLLQEAYGPNTSGRNDYEGIYALSQDIATGELGLILQDVGGTLINGNGSGRVPGNLLSDAAITAWQNAGNADLFPGNVFTPVELAVATGQALTTLYQILPTAINAMVFTDEDGILVAFENAGARFLEAVENIGSFISPGTLWSALALLVSTGFGKTPSDLLAAGHTRVDGPNGIELYVDSEGKVVGFFDFGATDALGVIGNLLGNEFNRVNDLVVALAGPIIGEDLAQTIESVLLEAIVRPLGENFTPADFTESPLRGINSDGDTQNGRALGPQAEGPIWTDTPDGGDNIIAGSDGFLSFGGSDNISGGEGNDIIFGLNGRDVLNGDGGDDILWGGDNADELNGGNGNDILRGGRGDDTFIASSGDDIISGGDIQVDKEDDGRDTVDYSQFENDLDQGIFVGLGAIVEGQARQTFIVFLRDDLGSLHELHSIEVLTGTDRGDSVSISQEFLDLGIEEIDLGEGTDVAFFDGVDRETGVNFEVSSVGVQGLSLLGIDDYILTDFDDNFTLVLEELSDNLSQTGGRFLSTFDAGDGNDIIDITIQSDDRSQDIIINLGEGNNTLNFDGADAFIFGGAEVDNVSVTSRSRTEVFGGAGDDVLMTTEVAVGGTGEDIIQSSQTDAPRVDLFGYDYGIGDTASPSFGGNPQIVDDNETDRLIGTDGVVDNFHVGNGDIIDNFNLLEDRFIFHFGDLIDQSQIPLGITTSILDGFPRSAFDGEERGYQSEDGRTGVIGYDFARDGANLVVAFRTTPVQGVSDSELGTLTPDRILDGAFFSFTIENYDGLSAPLQGFFDGTNGFTGVGANAAATAGDITFFDALNVQPVATFAISTFAAFASSDEFLSNATAAVLANQGELSAVDANGGAINEGAEIVLSLENLSHLFNGSDGASVVDLTVDAGLGTVIFDTAQQAYIVTVDDTAGNQSLTVNFVVEDGEQQTVGTIEYTVNDVNLAPVVEGVELGTIRASEGLTLEFSDADLLINATDIEGDVLTVNDVSITPTFGTIESNQDGTYTLVYTPVEGFEQIRGVISFNVSDGENSTTSFGLFDFVLDDEVAEAANPTNFSDQLIGTPNTDIIDALDGNDVIDGLASRDTLIGGLGSDTIIGGAGDDTLTGDSASGQRNLIDQDIFQYGDLSRGVVDIGNDVITDFDTNNFRGGENNFDTLSFSFNGIDYELSTGRDIRDFVSTIERDGDSDTDALKDGDDIIFVFDRNENGLITDSVRLEDVIGHDGITTSRLNQASIDELVSDDGFVLTGNSANDTIFGYNGNDIITGGMGSDTLIGGLGSDTIIGGSGNDILTSDEENGGNDRFDQDLFVFGDVDNSSIGNDVITDFDTNNFNGGENNFDRLELTIGGEAQSLSTGSDIINFAELLNTDDNADTGAFSDGDDLVFVFQQDAFGVVTDSIRLEDVIGDDGIIDSLLDYAMVDIFVADLIVI